MLIALRLPCVYIWRSQGGFGQYAFKGAPVSFANPVSELVRVLPRRASQLFSVLLENGQNVNVDVAKVICALDWLIQNNPLYKEVSVDIHALEDIASIQNTQAHFPATNTTNLSVNPDVLRLEMQNSTEQERFRGFQGHLDEETLYRLSTQQTLGIDDANNPQYAQMLVQHMLKPFKYRKCHLIPSYDASENLESYFPVLFPYGRGGPTTTGTKLAIWTKHVLSVHNSRFAKDIDFIFFLYAVLHRKRLSGLSAHAPLRNSCTKGIVEVRQLLSSDIPNDIVKTRIDRLLRSGALSASFENLRGSPAFWGALKKTAWAYLTEFGPCDLFITVSAADLIDPFVFMQTDPHLTYEEAANLSSQKRAELLAKNPLAATTIFHKRVESLFKNFMFGKTKPFGEIRAYLGRIEQQARHSPHLHLLIWLTEKGPQLTGDENLDGVRTAEFIEQFCTALLPEEHPISIDHLSQPMLKQPLPVHKTNRYTPAHFHPLSSTERHKALTRPRNANTFDGSKQNKINLRAQFLATRFHICQKYCLLADGSCRFLFPFPSQSRGSIARRTRSVQDSRKMALAPRHNPFLNSTHPMLTEMCRANTDVTIIVGISIAESMYVCSYAVKTDKNPLFDHRALRKLRKLTDGTTEDRKLLGTIARTAAGVRTVGAQEAIDFLVNNPVTFSSAKVKNIPTQFLLNCEGALSEEQKTDLDNNTTFKPQNVLPDLDIDEDVAINTSEHLRTNKRMRSRHSSYPMDHFLSQYIRRPDCLDSLSASRFHELYEVKKCTERQSVLYRDMLLKPSSQHESTTMSTKHTKFLVKRRIRNCNQPWPTHILNVLNRGEADDSSPRFAAAAITLHVPFRTTTCLLKGEPLITRLSSMLQDKEKYFELFQYVERSHALSTTNIAPFTAHHGSTGSLGNEENDSSELLSDISDSEDENSGEDPLRGLSPITNVSKEQLNTLKISKKWTTSTSYPNNTSLQSKVFRSYVSDCRRYGLRYANDKQTTNPGKDGQLCNNSGIINPIDAFEEKKRILSLCKTQEQKLWIQSVISYLQVFYSRNEKDLLEHLIKICEANHPILTSAPGGCGKSWLIRQVVSFITKCIPMRTSQDDQRTKPNTFAPKAETAQDSNEFFISLSEFPTGRLGRVAIFAPSGVAAGNCDGFTFHNGLRTNKITFQEILTDISPATLSKLIADFSQVVCIIIDEFSMASLILIAYLDKILRMVRPAFYNTPFGNISVIFTGDVYQLPVVSGHGLLSTSNSVRPELLDIQEHCTRGTFYIELSHSIRQGKDHSFSQLLNRLRTCESTQIDVNTLNSRYINDFAALVRDSPEWARAPILTSKNRTVEALNEASIYRNGETLGTFHIHSMPKFPKTKSLESRRKITTQYFKRANNTQRTRHQFCPRSVLVLYPGIPLMLRTNICTPLGLSNGSIGTLVSIAQDGFHLEPHESTEKTIERAIRTDSSNAKVPSLVVKFPHCYKGIITALHQNDANGISRHTDNTVLIDPQSFPRAIGLPVSVVHAMSMHKSQSLTLQFAIIDPRDTFCMGALYVAL